MTGTDWNVCCATAPALRRRTAGRARRTAVDLPLSPCPGPDGRTQIILSLLELIGRIAALLPPPRQHRHRYYGVLGPKSPLRPAVTALAPPAVAPEPESKPTVETAADDPPETIGRSPARYLWAMLLARIYEAFPLTCPQCGAKMRIIASITEALDVRRILEHIGEPATPPRVASARGPPEWYESSADGLILVEAFTQGDPLAQPEPDYEYDQQRILDALAVKLTAA